MALYIDVVNNILKRLRERTVETVNETTYSTLIGMLVNDAKEEVERAWDWSALRITLSADTTAGLFSYELNGFRNDGTILQVQNDTDNRNLSYKTAEWFNNTFNNQDQVFGSPIYYSFNAVSSDGDTQVDLYPVPDDTYRLLFHTVSRTPDLVNDGDILTVAPRAVELLAYAKAVEERGEDAGVMSSSAYATANKVLSDAIAYDTQKHPEEILIWYEV